MTKKILTDEYIGYQNGTEQTAIDPRAFIAGSKNFLIDTGRKSFTSRPGCTLFGAAGGSNQGIKGGFHWRTSTNQYFIGRTYERYLEVWFGGTWTRLLSNLSSPYAQFAMVFDTTEKKDIVCFVNGESKIQNWSGGAALARAGIAGATTLKLQGSYTASTIAFSENGSVPDTITDSANGFLDAGFAPGDTISVSGTANNNRKFTIGSVDAGTITLVPDDQVTTEAAGASVLIHNGFPTWGSRGFLITGTRKVLIGGVEYAYTGGEGTDTLTGVDPLPVIAAGTIVLQSVRSNNNASPIPTGYTNDYIGSQRNQLWIGSKTSRLAFASKINDFTSFTFTANRLPGEGAQIELDTFCAGFESSKDEITIFGGADDIYSVMWQLSADNTNEAVSVVKKDTAPGQGLISPLAKTRVKNAVAFITREPTLDTLGSVENISTEQNKPISDIIKNDFDVLDFTDAAMVYWKRNIVVTLPMESMILLYDLRYGMWQMPQIFAVSIGVLSISEEGNLIGHSYVANESYELFSGTVDETGVADFNITAIARHAYNNQGFPDQEKVFDTYYVDGYLSLGARMEHRSYYDFEGTKGMSMKEINGDDDRFLFGTSDLNPLGRNPLGSRPLGGGGLSEESLLTRFRIDLTYREKPYYEMISEFYHATEGQQVTVVRHGPNVTLLGTTDTSISD